MEVKVLLKRKGPGSYATWDGLFEVYRLHGRGCAKWQVRATHDRQVFSYTLGGKRHLSHIYNADTLNECREAIYDTYIPLIDVVLP